MEKEKKIFKGIVIGCLVMVLALTVWVININDTYSTTSSTTPKCKTINGVKYVYSSNYPLNDKYGCCPIGFSDAMPKIGWMADANHLQCFTPSSDGSKNGSCPAGYGSTPLDSGQCVGELGEIDNSACYYCTGNSVTGSNYLWSSGTPSVTCNGGSWIPQENITSSDRCVTPTQNYEVTFNVAGGKLYLNGKLQSRNVFKISELNYALYTATKDDYTFKGWSTSSACTSTKDSGTVNVKSDMTVYACFVKVIEDYNVGVFLDANNDSGIVYKNGTSTKANKYETTVKKNNYIDLTKYSAKASGYTFKGWSLTKSCDALLTKYLINNTYTFYACYNKDETPSSPGTSTPGTTTYSAKFNPNGGKFSDGTTNTKTIKYTNKKYFTESDIVVTRNGYKFLGWKNNSGDIFYQYIDKTDNGSTLTAQWQSNNSGGTTPSPNPDIGDETQCEYIYKDSCEVANDGYNCVKDENNCYVKGDKKQDDNIDCVYYNKNNCEVAYSGYNCIQDANGCYVKGSKKQDDNKCTYYSKNSCESAYSGYNCIQDANGCYVKGDKKGNSSSDPESNPNTGSSLLYLSIAIGIVTFVYSVYYANKIKKKEGN